MNKREFHKLLNYLRCHPSEAKLLVEVITNTGESIGQKCANQPDTSDAYATGTAAIPVTGTVAWLSAREAGNAIGKSSTWVRRRFKEGLFQHARQDGRGKYMFLKAEVLSDYNSYVLSRTVRIERL
jgi:hypothetical protein